MKCYKKVRFIWLSVPPPKMALKIVIISSKDLRASSFPELTKGTSFDKCAQSLSKGLALFARLTCP